MMQCLLQPSWMMVPIIMEPGVTVFRIPDHPRGRACRAIHRIPQASTITTFRRP